MSDGDVVVGGELVWTAREHERFLEGGQPIVDREGREAWRAARVLAEYEASGLAFGRVVREMCPELFGIDTYTCKHGTFPRGEHGNVCCVCDTGGCHTEPCPRCFKQCFDASRTYVAA